MRYSESTHLISNIKRNGDLLNDVYFIFELPAVRNNEGVEFDFVENIGEAIIEEYLVNVGGSTVDPRFSSYTEVFTPLYM